MLTTTLIPYSHELPWPEHLRPFETVDFEIQKDPFAHYAWMREHAPVLRTQTPARDVWFISRHDDVRAALRAPKVFSSAVVDPAPLVFLTLFDPPEHTRLRQVVASSFTPKAVAAFSDQVRGYAHGYLDELLAAGGGDVVEGFALRITMATISGLLGIPASDFDQMKAWSDDISSYFGRLARQAPGSEGDEEGAKAFFAYLLDNLDRARRDDTDSVGGNIARLLTEGVLTEQEAKHFCAFLFVAGHETTTILLANAFLRFAESPELLERIRRNPTDAAAFVEEMARHSGTIQRISRITTKDVEVAGVQIPAGEIVILLPGSANRDERRFADADRFDIDRDTNGHLGFGHGIHSCLGQHLARLEAGIGVELITQRLSRVELDPAHPIEFVTGGNLANTGPSRLVAKLTGRTGEVAR
ncbi:cytochrome P450 [Sinomonas sp. B1-1]|uniref:cytochrome P450 n=1 Tax=Sinomonas sp. B1-1 TaxID=3141454 RepID=UPI003D26C416